jgi:hypothetical protein
MLCFLLGLGAPPPASDVLLGDGGLLLLGRHRHLENPRESGSQCQGIGTLYKVSWNQERLYESEAELLPGPDFVTLESLLLLWMNRHRTLLVGSRSGNPRSLLVYIITGTMGLEVGSRFNLGSMLRLRLRRAART